MATKDVQRLRELEKENARLKRLLAERDLELDMVKEAFSKTGERSPEARLRCPGAPAWSVRAARLPPGRTGPFGGTLPGPTATH